MRLLAGLLASIHCTLVGRLYTTMRCSRFDLYMVRTQDTLPSALLLLHSKQDSTIGLTALGLADADWC